MRLQHRTQQLTCLHVAAGFELKRPRASRVSRSRFNTWFNRLCCFSAIRTARFGAMVAIGRAMVYEYTYTHVWSWLHGRQIK